MKSGSRRPRSNRSVVSAPARQLTPDEPAFSAAVAAVAQARLLFGDAKARQLWISFGLPDPCGSPTQARPAAPSRGGARTSLVMPPPELLESFLAQCTVREEHSRVQSRPLYEHFRSWMTEREGPGWTQKGFSMAMVHHGFQIMHSRCSFFVGLRLRPLAVRHVGDSDVQARR